MKNYRLYIADMDTTFVSRVQFVVSAHAGLEIVGKSGSGRQALMDIARLSPDVVMADITIRDMDGIALLREVHRLRRVPAVVICTRFYSEASLRCACKHGAAFFLCKPIEVQTLPDLLIESAKSLSDSARKHSSSQRKDTEAEDNRARATRALFKRLGIPQSLNGSTYIFEAVVHLKRDECLLKNMTHGLYAELAYRMNTTASRIERSLRNTISVAYERGSLSDHFKEKPTNREFLEFIIHEVDNAVFPEK